MVPEIADAARVAAPDTSGPSAAEDAPCEHVCNEGIAARADLGLQRMALGIAAAYTLSTSRLTCMTDIVVGTRCLRPMVQPYA
jgi:hypothetical protein